MMAMMAPMRRLAWSVYHQFRSYSDSASWPQHLPTADLESIFPGISEQSVSMRHRYEWRALTYGDAFALAAVTRFLRPRRIFEIGTFTGASTVLMAEQVDVRCKILTLDLPPNCDQLRLPDVAADPPESEATRIGERFRNGAHAARITQLFGDSATFDFSPYRNAVDLVFVDGSHSAAYVSNDTQRALDMLTDGGTIIWDDCSPDFPDVVRTLDRYGARVPIHRIAFTKLAIYTRHARCNAPRP